MITVFTPIVHNGKKVIVMQHPMPTTKPNIPELIKAYNEEYLRTTNLRRELTYKAAGGWFTFPSGDKGRWETVEKALAVLKTRPTCCDRVEHVNGVATVIKASQHVVKSLMAPHMEVIEERDTPYGCSVASEAYWSN